MTGLTDASCDLTKSYIYDAFRVETNPDGVDANPFRYCGEYFDKETETYYLRARYYKPSTGRFLTEDPIRYGLNIYTYCNNNPVSFTDPSGLSEESMQDFDYMMDMMFLNGAGSSSDPSTYATYLYFTNSENAGKPIPAEILIGYLNFIASLDFYQGTQAHETSTGTIGDYVGRAVDIIIKNIFFHDPTKIFPNVTNYFGEQDRVSKEYHLGIDIGHFGHTNLDIFSIFGGKVVFSGDKGKNGNMIIIEHLININGTVITFYSSYSHLSKLLIGKDANVKAGEKIGIMGETGNSNGVHLHFAIFTTKMAIEDVRPRGYVPDIVSGVSFTSASGNTTYYNPLEFFKMNGAILR